MVKKYFLTKSRNLIERFNRLEELSNTLMTWTGVVPFSKVINLQ